MRLLADKHFFSLGGAVGESGHLNVNAVERARRLLTADVDIFRRSHFFVDLDFINSEHTVKGAAVGEANRRRNEHIAAVRAAVVLVEHTPRAERKFFLRHLAVIDDFTG